MYFWNIDALKKDLKKDSLKEREIFQYFLLTIVLYNIGMIPLFESNIWDVYSALFTGIITIMSVIYAYVCNGGAKGKNFAMKYFSLSWVVGIRWMVFCVIPGLILFLMAFQSETDFSVQTTPLDVIFSVLIYLPYVWLLGKHMKEVAN